MLTDVLAYLLVPAVAILIGGMVAVVWIPGAQLRSALQHFAAGVVFAAVAGELLPEIMHGAMPVPVIVGFTLGVALMLAIKWFAGRNEAAESEAKSGLVAIIGVDIAIDGLLVGVSFSAGTKAGVLVTLALSLEVLFLALSTAATQIGDGVSRAKVAATAFAFAIVLVAAAVAGVTSLDSLSPAMLEGVLAFGVAALLYLVTEELLVEAHEVEETPLTTATFFAGFLVILLIEMAI
jgi:zinc transporter, ZIP family